MAGDIEQVLKALGRAEVRYLVVGGVAVVLHGYLRATADLDLLLALDEVNVRRAVSALEALGYRPRAGGVAGGPDRSQTGRRSSAGRSRYRAPDDSSRGEKTR
ncbi:MAG TPA: hypothetical protein VHQ65_00040 [Thermoanaerobaculia bacterium]|nr:hypothetical protein [Thermoanaerobaculia bacterium]